MYLLPAVTDDRSKLEATTPLLDKARGEYEGLTKATTDARSSSKRPRQLLAKLAETTKD